MTEHYLNRLARTINENWDSPALTDFYLTEDGTSQDTTRGNHYTYGEMYAELCHVAELLTSLGLQKGDHIAICGANSSHWVIAYLAIAKMQGVSVTVMHSLMPDEIARLVDFADAKALFTDENLWEELKSQPMPQVESVIGLENWQILRGENLQISNLQSPISNSDCGFPQSNPDSLAMICFTSGTSGKSKGVMLSYGAISATSMSLDRLFPVGENKKILSVFPLAHMYGLLGDVLSQLNIGSHISFTQTLNLANIVRLVLMVKPFQILLVPALLGDLTKSKNKELVNSMPSFLQYALVGGAVVNELQIAKLRKAKCPLTVGYGMTETASIISVVRPNEYRAHACGKAVSTLTARISPAGEILVKGENVMLGYYKDPEATACKIDADGWLHTGDKGHLDEDGYLYVEGRLEQDMIVLPNGENIRQDNIEALINAIPEVSESIVLARDGKLVAIVVPQITNDQSPMTNTDLRHMVLRTVNPSLPLFSQLYDVEITDQPLARTEKQTIKRYLYS